MKKILKILLNSTLFILTVTTFSGCKAKIGDSCTYDADCSKEADRTCDNSQPGGYCLIITCTPDRCPKEASCVEYLSPSPEFDTTDTDTGNFTPILYEQLEPNRTRTYCMQRCKKDKDCRGEYHCAGYDELTDEINARIIDKNGEDDKICIPTVNKDTQSDSADSDSKD